LKFARNSERSVVEPFSAAGFLPPPARLLRVLPAVLGRMKFAACLLTL